MTVIQRHKLILQFIPEDPKSISTKELLGRVKGDFPNINLRMLQRDLDNLHNDETNIIKEKKGQDNLWSFLPLTKTAQVMTPSVALAFNMLEEYAKHLLPSSVNNQLQGHFSQAKEALIDPNLALWQTKIATLQSGFQLHKAEIDADILDTVEKAIIEQAQLEVVYQNRPKANIPHVEKKRLINPLGLAIRGNVYYLVATTPDNEFRNFALHRMTRAQKSYNEVQFPDNFDLNKYIEEGHLTFSKQQVINLQLKVNRISGYHLLETPLCTNQEVTHIDDDHFIIKADLHESDELHWWLMSLADISEVLAPKALREQIISNLQKAMGMYS